MVRIIKYLFIFATLTIPLTISEDKEHHSEEATTIAREMGEETTMALISGTVTRDGYPILWKNRDRRERPNQEAVWFNDGNYPYIGLVNAGDSTEVWGGLNSVGFGIVNSNAYNLIDSVPGPDDDGLIMKRALQICRTVEDFQDLLDSTSVVGRRRTCNYGVIDAEGGAALFECAAVTYTRFNASDTNDAPDGFCVRANYAYSGDDTGSAGRSRHDRVYELLMNARERNELTAGYVLKYVAPDIATQWCNPYPLPFEDVYPDSGWPHGYVSIYTSINRNITPFGIVVQGVPEGESPILATLWAGLGKPVSTIPVPLWVYSGSTPWEVNGDSTALICDNANRIFNRLINPYLNEDALNTYQLLDGQGGGLFTITIPAMDSIFEATENILQHWREDNPQPEDMAEFAQSVAQYACERLQSWTGKSLFRVPLDYASLQEAVDAASDGDTVIVSRGIYPGPLEFRGRKIVVASEFLFSRDPTDIDSTIIDGNRSGRSVVVFNQGETNRAELVGFTIRNGQTNYGGGIYLNGASPTLRYLVIYNNQATRSGGGIYCTQNSRPKLDHITCYRNTAVQNGGAIYCLNNSNVEITNSIIWNNTPSALADTFRITYSDVQGGNPGIGNINRNPMFVNPDSGNFHLRWDSFPADDSTRSPCIDTGAPNFRLDPDSTRTDMGAIFFNQGTPPYITSNHNELLFNDILVNTYVTAEIYITNLGERELRVQSQSIRYIEGPPFIFISRGGGSFNLATNDSHLTEITFCPLIHTKYYAIFTIESNDIYRNPYEINIYGRTQIPSNIDEQSFPTSYEISGIYPNPSNSSVNITINIPTASFITLRIMDIEGREIEKTYEGSVAIGQKQFCLSVQDYPNGIYIVEFKTPLKTYLGKMIVLK